MCKSSRYCVLLATALLMAWNPLSAHAQNKIRESINKWTIGLVAGRVEGQPLRLAAELARVLDDGDNFRLLPVVSRGIFDNFNDLLYLRGIDAAIVNGDTLQHFANLPNIKNVKRRVHYVANLFPAELHVLVRPEINSLADLAGKPVNFNTHGTAAAYSGPIIFDHLGVAVRKTFIPHRIAMGQMKQSNKFAAVVFMTTKPVRPMAQGQWPEGFKLLPVPYTKALEDFYLPTYLTSSDYPKLISAGSKIETIAVPVVLAVYNWRPNYARYSRMLRFVDYIFERLPKLQKPPFHPRWRDVNLAGVVPGWNRYPPVQRKLQQRLARSR